MKKILLIILATCFFILPANFALAEDTSTAENMSKIFQLDVSKLKYDQKQLVYAVLMGNEKDIKTILDSDSNPKTTYSKLPLTLYAVYGNHLNSLKLLIEYGFNPEESFIGVSAIDIAIYLKRYNHIEYLLSIGVQLKPEDYEIINKSKDKRLKEIFNK